MPKTSYVCPICGKAVTHEEIRDDETRIIKIPAGTKEFVHAHHNGVEEEYARQV